MGFPRYTDRLFFAAYPDRTTADRIVELAWDHRDDYGLRGLPLLPQHIHSTLWHVGDDLFPPPDRLVEALVQRASAVKMPAFRVSFDHVGSFGGGALVLRGQEGVAGLEMLHVELGAVLGIATSPAAFTPHVTLLRDKRLLQSRPVEPIEWTVTEFVLVHSLLGKTVHRDLGRIPLG